MEKSISKNSIFYLVYNVLNVLFPFISSMYVARVLLPSVIGDVAYAQNIVQYFVIFSFLGIPTYALREISKNRHNKDELNKVYSELIIINFFSTCLFGIMYCLCIYIFFRDSIELYLIVGLSIALNVFNNSWLFEALEEFKYISIRNFIFKIVVFLGIIIFVRSSKDYYIYAAMTVIGTAGNYFFNILQARKFVKFQISSLNFRRHLRSIFILVCVNLAIEVYTLVDTTMLGIFCSKDKVAYYTYASRINKIFIQIINTFTIVIVPRLSFLYKENKLKEYNLLISKTFKLIVLISLPAIVGIQFVGGYFVVLLFGSAYKNSIIVLKILSCTMLISPIGYLLGSRVMVATEQENKMIICVGTGAITNIIGNMLLIPLYNEIGAAIASVLSELLVMFTYLYFGKTLYSLINIKDSIIKICFSTAIVGGYLYACNFIIRVEMIRAFVQLVGAFFIYFLLLYFMKEELVVHYGKRIILSKRCG